jgi:hypothetical protein
VDYLLPVPGELTDYLYWFCQQLVSWRYQAKQIALDLEEISQKRKLQRDFKGKKNFQIRKRAKKKRQNMKNALKLFIKYIVQRSGKSIGVKSFTRFIAQISRKVNRTPKVVRPYSTKRTKGKLFKKTSPINKRALVK